MRQKLSAAQEFIEAQLPRLQQELQAAEDALNSFPYAKRSGGY